MKLAAKETAAAVQCKRRQGGCSVQLGGLCGSDRVLRKRGEGGGFKFVVGKPNMN